MLKHSTFINHGAVAMFAVVQAHSLSLREIAMSKRIPKIPYPNEGVEITFEMPNEETRRAIEESYGHELPPKAWAQVAIATAGYLEQQFAPNAMRCP